MALSGISYLSSLEYCSSSFQKSCQNKRSRSIYCQFEMVCSPSWKLPSRANLYLHLKIVDRSIPAVARTVSAAFTSDPLIQWLRPSAIPWGYQDPTTQKWQCRRVRNVMSEGIVLRSASVGQMAQEYPRQSKATKPSDSVVVPEKTAQVSLAQDREISVNQNDDAGAVVFLFPPNGHLPWSISSAWLTWKLWFLELFNPVQDNSSKEEVRNNNVCDKKVQC